MKKGITDWRKVSLGVICAVYRFCSTDMDFELLLTGIFVKK